MEKAEKQFKGSLQEDYEALSPEGKKRVREFIEGVKATEKPEDGQKITEEGFRRGYKGSMPIQEP